MTKKKLKEKTCGKKIRHATFNDAMVAIKKLEKKQFFIHRRHAYKCPYCGGWHVGTTHELHPKLGKKFKKLLKT
jgi:hypothetical protein